MEMNIMRGPGTEETSHLTMIALTLLVSLLSVHVLSLPAPDGAVGHGGHGDEYNERPDPFHFEYGVHDDKYHTDFSEQRSGDGSGSMKGEYTVALPDKKGSFLTLFLVLLCMFFLVWFFLPIRYPIIYCLFP